MADSEIKKETAADKLARGIVEIHGRDYQTVAMRIQEMYGDHPEWGIETELLHVDTEGATVRACVIDGSGKVRGSGLAEEKRATSSINASSALENCETSAVGRALANAGYLGVAIASAEEMEEHKVDTIVRYFINYLEVARTNWDEITAHKDRCAENDGYLKSSFESMAKRIGDDAIRVLWKAPDKGSVFTTMERDMGGATKPEDDPDLGDPDNVKMQ